MDDPSEPFRAWSPFGVWPGMAWAAWATQLLPDHFEPVDPAKAPARPQAGARSAALLDFQAYRQRRLNQRGIAGARARLTSS